MLKNTQVIKPVMIACSAGLLLTACATDRESEYSSSSEGYSTGASASIQEGSGSDWQQSSTSRSSQTWGSEQSGRSYSQSSQQMSGDQVVIPLHEERLNVGKRTVDAGTVTIRKVVTTETVNQPIELRRETLVIDREGAGAQRSTQFQSSTSSQNQTSGANASFNAGAGESGAGVSAQAGAGQSGAGVSAGADQSGAGISADANLGDTNADAQATAEIESDSDAAANAQSDFNQSEAAGANAANRSTTQSSQSYSSSQSSQGSQNYSSGATSGTPFQEQTYTIQLREEQPVVEKSVVQTGQVTARKNAEMQRQTVQREVRREDVRVDQGANARNVQLRGDFDTAGRISEPSGASQRQADVSAESESRTYQSESEITTETSGAQTSGVYQEGDTYEDRNTLDDINRGSNTRGGAEDLQNFDERSTPRE